MALESRFGASTRRTWAAPEPKKKKEHHWWDAVTDNVVTAFIGHLGTDIEHAVTGIPAGVLQLVEHPVGSVKAMGKATWADWSPLFHGDVDKWKHQTFEHPLAPILDIASIVTLGAGTAAKGAAGVSRIAEATAATQAGKTAAATGRLARFANPAKAAERAHYERYMSQHYNPARRGLKNYRANMEERAAAHARSMLRDDKTVGRVHNTPGGLEARRAWSTNPAIRLRQKQVARLTNKIADAPKGSKRARVVQGLDEAGVHLGDAAWARQWTKGDRSQRSAGTVAAIAQQLGGIRAAAKAMNGMTIKQRFELIADGIHKRQRDQAHEVIWDGTKKQLHALAAEGYGGLRETPDFSAIEKHLAKDTEEGFGEAMRDYGKASVLNPKGADFEKLVARGKRKNSILVVKRTTGAETRRLTAEAANTHRLMQLMYHNPTKAWKYVVLGMAPRYFINNVVGNSLMLAMSANPVAMARGIHMHTTMVHGARAADKQWIELRKAAGGPNMQRDIAAYKANRKAEGLTVNDRVYAGEHIGQSMAEAPAGTWNSKKGAWAKTKHAGTINYRITHKLSDTYHRDIAINYTIMRTPEWQRAYSMATQRGLKGNEARVFATKTASESTRVKQFVRENVNHTLGQYHHFNKTERLVKGVVPFYSWDRAITRHTAEMVKTRPYQAAMLAAIGQRGHDSTIDIMGNLPDFMAGIVPTDQLHNVPLIGHQLDKLAEILGAKAPGKKGILLTAGLNPYSSIGELMHTARSAAGGTPRVGDSFGGMINPVLRGSIEMLTGTDMSTGTPTHQTGGVLGVYLGPLGNLPPIKLGAVLKRKYLGDGEQQPKDPNHPFLYSKTVSAQTSGLLGLPIRQANPDRIAELWREQEGKKKPESATFKRRSSPAASSRLHSNMPGL